MFKGTIVKSSLQDPSILETLEIKNSYQSGSWTLFDILVSEKDVPLLQKSLADGPWYIHLWEQGKDDVVVVFKNKVFSIKFSDKATWKEAVDFGLSIGIPPEQLDFPID